MNSPSAEPFAVGDSVRVKGGYAPRRILSIVTAYRVTSAHNALNQSPATFEANDLERIEAQSPETKAGDCLICGEPVMQRSGKPGEFDHDCYSLNGGAI